MRLELAIFGEIETKVQLSLLANEWSLKPWIQSHINIAEIDTKMFDSGFLESVVPCNIFDSYIISCINRIILKADGNLFDLTS